MAKQQLKSDSNSELELNSKERSLLQTITGRKSQLIIGAGLIIISFFVFVSCISFIISGQNDLDLVLSESNQFGTASLVHFDNWMGKTGVYLSYWLIYRGFGIAGISIPFLSFILGCVLAFKTNPLSVFKSIRWSIYSLIIAPLILGFLFHSREEEPFPHIVLFINDRFVGAYGVWITQYMVFTFGKIGTGLILLGTGIISLIFHFGSWIDELLKRKSQKNHDDLKEDSTSDTTLDSAPWEDNSPSETPTINPEKNLNATTIKNNFIPEIENQENNEEMEFEVYVQEPTEAHRENTEPLTISSELDLASFTAELGMEVEKPKNDEILSDQEVDNRLGDFGDYDPKLDLSKYIAPSIEILKNHGSGGVKITKEELEENKNKIIQTLNHYKIEIEKIKATIGPTVTLYEINPAPGIRISKIKNLEDDIALSLAALGIRIIAPIPGKGTIGIEVPNSQPEIVSMRSLIASEKFQHAEMELPVVLGKTISNEIFVADLAKMPHLLMAGATGQGKSVGLNAILVSLLYKKHPSQIKFVLVDPKKVELTLFNKIERHFLAKLPDSSDPIITDTSKVVRTLNSLCIEMDERYELLKTAGVRNIKEYNDRFIKRRLNPQNGHRFLPYIVLVVDEFADLIMTAGREVETPIARLAQLARAIGIHLIIATQRPSVNIITGTIKANFPARIAFRVTSKIDSRTILDAGGAEQLIGRGDLLFSSGNDLIRVQCGFVDTPEVEEITEFIGNQQGYPTALHLPEVPDENGSGEITNFASSDRDDLFDDAARLVVQTQQGSASMLQRKLKLGFNRAGRLVDQLEAAGIIGPFEGSKARKVLFQDEFALEQFLKSTK